jgi:hypothetical protein
MRAIIQVLLVNVVLLAGGCTHSFRTVGLDGRWRGCITENGRSTLVELNLRSPAESVEGTFTILSDTGQDADKGASFQIVRAQRRGCKVRFIVPFSGEVDNDAVVFDLNIEKNRLTGFGREMAKGSQVIPVIFTRQNE